MSLPTLLALHGGVQGNELAAHIWHQVNPLGGGWLPEHVSIRGRKQGGKKGVLGDLVVSERWQGSGGEEGEEMWVACADGKRVQVLEDVEMGLGGEGEEVERAYELMAVVSFVAAGGRRAGESDGLYCLLFFGVSGLKGVFCVFVITSGLCRID